MLTVPQYKRYREIEHKLQRGEVPTPEEQELVAKWGIRGPKKCPRCTNPVEPRVDGAHHTLDDEEVCADCYFDVYGEVEQYPIGTRGIRRRI